MADVSDIVRFLLFLITTSCLWLLFSYGTKKLFYHDEFKSTELNWIRGYLGSISALLMLVWVYAYFFLLAIALFTTTASFFVEDDELRIGLRFLATVQWTVLAIMTFLLFGTYMGVRKVLLNVKKRKHMDTFYYVMLILLHTIFFFNTFTEWNFVHPSALRNQPGYQQMYNQGPQFRPRDPFVGPGHNLWDR